MVRSHSNSPYKFLDPYTEGDKDIFFGRGPEIEILVADVIVQRLVVLFARTGTGKTSLINAGVRPRLVQEGYAAYSVRVRPDPTNPNRVELRSDQPLTGLKGDGLGDQLRHLAAAAKKPVVIFFDQFEEFFLHIYGKYARTDPTLGKQFIKDVAALYYDEESGIHSVFSMREEFFAEMDAFRDEIPNIFHKDSSLRLRWFNKDQAREAIVKPALARGFNVTYEKNLVDKLIEDMTTREPMIEPAQLQIVCDTLWREKGDAGTITLDTYLAHKDPDPNNSEPVAMQITDRRIEAELEEFETEEELDLLARLLPVLGSERGTKVPRTLRELREKLKNAEEETLSAVIDGLEDSGLIRKNETSGTLVVELSHDYLAGRLDYFCVYIGAIWPRRMLERATAAQLKEMPTPEQLRTISESLVNQTFAHARIILSDEQVEFLFSSAVSQGLYMRPWLDELGKRNPVRVNGVLSDALADFDVERAANVVKLLVDLQTPWAFQLLEQRWARESLASKAIDLLSRVETKESVSFLQRTLSQSQFALEALDALVELVRSHKPEVATEAGIAVVDYLEEQLAHPDLAPSAIVVPDVLSRVETTRSVRLVARTLRDDAVASDAVGALAKLARSRKPEVAAHAGNAIAEYLRSALGRDIGKPETFKLLNSIDSMADPAKRIVLASLEQALTEEQFGLPALRTLTSTSAVDALVQFLASRLNQNQLSPGSVELLGKLEKPSSVELLKSAARQEALRTHVQSALQALAQSDDRHVAVGAEEALRLMGLPSVASASIGQLRDVSAETFVGTQGRRPKSSAIEPPYGIICQELLKGQIIFFLGPGASLSARLTDVQESLSVPTGRELARRLADWVNYPSDDPTEEHLSLVASYVEMVSGRRPLLEELHQVFDHDYSLGVIHHFLAELNVPLLVFVTTYDDLIERAFVERSRPFHLVTYTTDYKDVADSVLWWKPGAQDPKVYSANQLRLPLADATIIYKLQGGVDRLTRKWDGFVITEEDYADFLVRMSSGTVIPPRLMLEFRRRRLLFLGFSARDWVLRVLLRYLEGPERPLSAGWAVQRNPVVLDKKLWESRGIEVYDIDLNDFVTAVQERTRT